MPLAVAAPASSQPRDHALIVVHDDEKPAASFSPQEAFGADIDGGGKGEVAPIFSRRNRDVMLGAGFSRIAYRLRTELAIEAWHWSSAGSWSDAGHQQGYWTGNPLATNNGQLTYGYRLPRRGNTHDEANNDGYSRLDDGDQASFWKSNPYLDASYTGEKTEHPEWAVVELDHRSAVDAVRIRWGQPYARQYAVQYWVGADPYDGHWNDFPGGRVTNGAGGSVTLALARLPIRTRYVRILLQRSSHTAPAGATDPRDRLGFAIAEVSVGTKSGKGGFIDLVRHGPARQRQTVMHVSSTDPWHRASDRDPDTEQPSIEEISRLGLLQHRPMMAPIGLLYDTPENAVAEIRYLRHAGIPVRQVELGEEPDGQLVSAPDYGALFLEFARRIHKVAPDIALGGPSLVNGVSDTWLDGDEDESWTSQFIHYLHAHGGTNQLGFFSFELFPFDNMCGPAGDKLLRQNPQMAALYRRLAEDKVPTTVPWVISEYGFSAFAGETMVEMPSALLNADMIADFLTRGGSASYLYGYAPSLLLDGESRCAGRGNMMLWQADTHGQARWPMPTYFGGRLMTQFWAEPGAARHLLYRATSDLHDRAGHSLVTAYPLRRPDGQWAVMLINRDATAVSARIDFGGTTSSYHHNGAPKEGRLTVAQYSQAQYAWRAGSGESDGHPVRDLPPQIFTAEGWDQKFLLPPTSLTVVRGLRPLPDGLALSQK